MQQAMFPLHHADLCKRATGNSSTHAGRGTSRELERPTKDRPFPKQQNLFITAAKIYVPAAADIRAFGRRQLAPFIEGFQQVFTKNPGVDPRIKQMAWGLDI